MPTPTNSEPAKLSSTKTKVLSDIELLVANGHPGAWWYKGEVRSSELGWPAVFKAANYHCVYCRKNISVSLEELVGSTTDHVVPQLLFSERGSAQKGPNHLNNLVPACSVCNSIKASWHPKLDSDAWVSRKAFIAAVRKHIKEVKDDRRKTYGNHINRARITFWSGPEHADFL